VIGEKSLAMICKSFEKLRLLLFVSLFPVHSPASILLPELLYVFGKLSLGPHVGTTRAQESVELLWEFL
jgi:hypothetical protein